MPQQVRVSSHDWRLEALWGLRSQLVEPRVCVYAEGLGGDGGAKGGVGDEGAYVAEKRALSPSRICLCLLLLFVGGHVTIVALQHVKSRDYTWSPHAASSLQSVKISGWGLAVLGTLPRSQEHR